MELWERRGPGLGWRGPYVAQESIGDPSRVSGTGLQLTQEEVAVKVPQLLQVAKEMGTLATEALGHIRAIQLGEVALHGVVEGAHVLPLGSHHLQQHQLEPIGKEDSGPGASALLAPSCPPPVLPAPVGTPGLRTAW